MPSLAVYLWLLNIAIDTAGHVAFKAAATKSDGWTQMALRPWIWLGIVCFGVEFVVWLAFLSLVPLSLGVLLGSINIVVLMLVGNMYFGETFTRMRVTGILLVALGVAIVGAGQI